MTDHDDDLDYEFVVMCDYCRQYVPVAKAITSAIPHRALNGTRWLCTIGTYCAPYCAGKQTTWAAAG